MPASSPTSATRFPRPCPPVSSPRPLAPRRRVWASWKGSATGSPASPASGVAPWPTTQADAGPSPLADTPPPPSSRRSPARPLRSGRSASCEPGRGLPAGCVSPPVMPSSLTSSTPPSTASPMGSNGPWTTSARSAGPSSPSPSSPWSHPRGDRALGHPGTARHRRHPLRHPPHRGAEGRGTDQDPLPGTASPPGPPEIALRRDQRLRVRKPRRHPPHPPGHRLLGPGRSHSSATTTALWLYVAYNAAATVASIPAGRHADRTKTRRTLAIGVIAFGVAYAGLTRAPTAGSP